MAVTAFGKGYILAPGDTLDAATIGHPGGSAYRLRINQLSAIIAGATARPQITIGRDPRPVTITLASPGVFTSVAHRSYIGATVRFSTTGALPTGITAGTTYFIIAAGFTANTFQIATSVGGIAINTSVSQSGVHTMISGTQIWGTNVLPADTTNALSAFGAYQELDNIHLTTLSTGSLLVVYLSE